MRERPIVYNLVDDMAESSPEAEYVGNQIKGEANKKRTPVWERRSTRRRFLGGAAVAGGAVLLESQAGLFRGILDRLIHKESSTSEQESAKILYNGPDDRLKKGLTVAGSGQGDEINLRNRPLYSDNPEDDISKVIGKLGKGFTVEKALPVWGNNPDKLNDKSTKAIWYAFPSPDDSEKFVFAYSGLFEPHEKPERVFDLETRSVREEVRTN